MPQPLSTKDFDAMVQKLGSVGAAMRWAQENGYKVNWDDASMELPALPGQEPVYEQQQQPAGGLGMASEQVAGSEEEGAAPSGGLSSFADLEKELLGYPAKQAKQRQQAFEQGQQYIAQAYAGPSVSQQLFALSKALLSPKPYRGFAGTMANVSSALSDVAKTREEASRKRALAEMELKSSFDKGSEDDYYEALRLRYQLVKEANDERAAAAKAGMPKYQWDSGSGRWVVQPGSGGLPPMNPKGQYVVRTPEEAASVPTGQPFVYAGGDPGKVYYGQ